jgi:hypothetical protein
VNNGALIVTGDTLSNVSSLVISGSGGTGFGAQTWDGPGIMSTNAQADTLGRSVGYLDNDNFILGPQGTIDGVAVPAGAMLVKSTLAGDTELNGKVDDDDVTVLSIFYDGGATTGHHWFEGDWDFNGKVDDDDVTIISITYGQTLPSAPAVAGGLSAVPEPGSLALLSVAGAALLRRRRRA